MESITQFLYEINTLKNKPKNVTPREWLKIKKPLKFKSESWFNTGTWGQSQEDGKFYGWSHRAIYGFGVGDIVKKNTLGNSKNIDWKIKNEKEAAEMAAKFSNSVS